MVTWKAAVTSKEKSMCPGVSMRLIRKLEPYLLCLMKFKLFSKSLEKNEMAVGLVVIHCS